MGILSDRQIRGEVTIDPMAENLRRPGVISYGLSSYGYDCRLGYKFKVFKPYPCTVIDPKNFDPRMLEEVDVTPIPHDFVESLQAGEYKDEYDGYCRKCIRRMKTSDATNNCSTSPPNFITIPPHSFVLGESLERFWIPRDVLCVVVGKSTYARCGLIVNVTPGEPEWGGKWTIEISNTTPLPAKVYAGEGIMQCLFFRSDERRQGAEQILKTLVDEIGTGRPKLPDGAIDHDTLSFMLWKDFEQAMNSLADLPDVANCKISYKDKSGKYQHQTGVTNPKVEGDK